MIVTQMGRAIIRGASRTGATATAAAARRGLQTAAGTFEARAAGTLGTADFRMDFVRKEGGEPVSPWHDIPLDFGAGDGVFTFLNEIPRYTTPKMEVDTKSELNPVVQDVKKGALRDYHGPLYWNYGCIPQTWEDPDVLGGSEVNGAGGDNDPLDVVEIGSATLGMGSLVGVKPLGALSMIDDGELDWKIIAVSIEDPLAGELNDLRDVERLAPGTVSGIREWFRWYKTPDGKPCNAFGHGEEALSLEATLEVIAETHAQWQALVSGERPPPDKLWLPSRA